MQHQHQQQQQVYSSSPRRAFKYTSLVVWLVSSLVLVLMIWFVLTPTPIKYFIKSMRPHVEDEANPLTARITPRYTVYSHNFANSLVQQQPSSPSPSPLPPQSLSSSAAMQELKSTAQPPHVIVRTNNTKLIVVIMGGCGLFSNLKSIYGVTNWLDQSLGPEGYDIVTFAYPTRFKYTIRETMMAINAVLTDFIHYKQVHMIGVSFGALLAGAFYHKERSLATSRIMQIPQLGIRINSFVSLSGLLETQFNAALVTKLVDHYIMSDVPGKGKYSCFDMDVPRMIVSARSDFLVAQSLDYCRTEGPELWKIYNNSNLPHAFVQYTNLPESIECLQLVAGFIRGESFATSARQIQLRTNNMYNAGSNGTNVEAMMRHSIARSEQVDGETAEANSYTAAGDNDYLNARIEQQLHQQQQQQQSASNKTSSSTAAAKAKTLSRSRNFLSGMSSKGGNKDKKLMPRILSTSTPEQVLKTFYI